MTELYVHTGEGSEHNGGGIEGVSDTFADTFYYLYQLCQVLISDVPGTVRSDLMGGHYELIDKTTFIANPSYWILYLFKQFIGDEMYQVNITTTIEKPNFRGYGFKSVTNNNGLVVALINFDMKNEAQITLKVDDKTSGYKYEEYHLTAYGNGGLQAKQMKVNDVVMEYKNGKFPTLEAQQGNGVVTMKNATLAFVVLTPQ